MNEEDFINFYNKTSLSNPITLKKVQHDSITTGNKIKDQGVLISKLNELMAYSKDHDNEQYIKILIQNIKESFNLSTISRGCKNPCCMEKPDMPDTRLNKAKTLMSSNFSKP